MAATKRKRNIQSTAKKGVRRPKIGVAFDVKLHRLIVRLAKKRRVSYSRFVAETVQAALVTPHAGA